LKINKIICQSRPLSRRTLRRCPPAHHGLGVRGQPRNGLVVVRALAGRGLFTAASDRSNGPCDRRERSARHYPLGQESSRSPPAGGTAATRPWDSPIEVSPAPPVRPSGARRSWRRGRLEQLARCIACAPDRRRGRISERDRVSRRAGSCERISDSRSESSSKPRPGAAQKTAPGGA
jgi:hypothetical protein